MRRLKLTVLILGCILVFYVKEPIFKIWKEFSEKQTKKSATKNCFKRNPYDSYQICERLPFSDIECVAPRNEDEDEHYLVPNIVHFIWTGNKTFGFVEYLSIRSAAANQKPEVIMFHITDEKPQGDLWRRVEEEIPCIKMVKFTPPDNLFDEAIKGLIHKTEITRMQILLKFGGIYLDTDALVLKSLDPLRKYPFTIGRSVPGALSSGIMLSEPNSTFLQNWLQIYKIYQHKEFFTKVSLRMHLIQPELPIHIEDISMQRPNPWKDGLNCISKDSFNISSNYFLHIHPYLSGKTDGRILSVYREKELVAFDTTYGAGARSALFGTQDLIFLKSHENRAHNRKPATDIVPFLPFSEMLDDNRDFVDDFEKLLIHRGWTLVEGVPM